MEKNSTKILLLVGAFIIIGLAFTLFAGTSSEKKSAPEVTKPETEMNLAQKTERELFAKNLDKLKEIIQKPDQKDLSKFKEQTRDGVLLLTDLINELPKAPGEKSDNVLEKTLQAKSSAEKIVLLDNENQVINQIKSSFENAKNAIKDIKDNLNCEKKNTKVFCIVVDKHLSQIEKINKEMNKKNYKKKTKEIFLHFHSLLGYMDKEMSKPKFLISNQQQNNDQDVNPVVQAEQKVNKTEEKEEAKSEIQKMKSKCKDCEKCEEHKHKQEHKQ